MRPRSAGIDWLMQMSANLVGTVLGAGVIYVVGVLAGAIDPNTVLTIISTIVPTLAGFVGFLLKRQALDRDDGQE